jgi:hypothetical protein
VCLCGLLTAQAKRHNTFLLERNDVIRTGRPQHVKVQIILDVEYLRTCDCALLTRIVIENGQIKEALYGKLIGPIGPEPYYIEQDTLSGTENLRKYGETTVTQIGLREANQILGGVNILQRDYEGVVWKNPRSP